MDCTLFGKYMFAAMLGSHDFSNLVRSPVPWRVLIVTSTTQIQDTQLLNHNRKKVPSRPIRVRTSLDWTPCEMSSLGCWDPNHISRSLPT